MLRAAHRRLLEHRGQNGETPEFLAEIEEFICRGRATGALLDAHSDRWQAQNLLDYWANELSFAHRDAPETILVNFDPSLAPKLDETLCPYLGLEAFGTTKHPFFFGRNLLIDKMVQMLKYSRFLAVVGPSGSGKSSAVLAGLLPQLQIGALHESEKWRYYPPMVPGTNPQVNLAQIIQPPRANNPERVQKMADRLLEEPGYLVKLINRVDKRPVVIVIDQFEEIFTLCEDDGRRRAFFNTLLNLIQTPVARHTVILTMRADVETNLVQFPTLQAAFEQSQVRVAAMKAAELREAIEKPAELVGLKFEENLVDELIREVLGKPAALPLLQFTLLKLWETREHNRVTWQAYRRLGGGRQALANTADAFYDGLSAADQVTARKILLAIVHPGTGIDITPDRIVRQTLYEIGEPTEQIDQVLDQLVKARLVRLSPGIVSADDQVEFAHESLVRIWPRLVGWLEEDRVAQRHRMRLATMAEQWQVLGRDPSALLRGLLLEEAMRYEGLNEIESAFVAASITAADQERLEKEAAQQRELAQARALAEAERKRAEESARFARRLSRLAFALAAIFAVAVLAALWAARNGEIARQNAATAVANEAVAEQLRVTAESSAARAVAAQSTAEADAGLRATAEADARQQSDTAEQKAIEAEEAQATAIASAAEAEEARTIARPMPNRLKSMPAKLKSRLAWRLPVS
jgi:hypothetical protein